MKNEKHFYPTIEQKELNLNTYQVYFDHSHFNNTKERLGTDELVGKLNEWWDKTCSENNLDPKDEKVSKLGYCVIELGKNALEHTDQDTENGEINVTFEPDKIKVIVISNEGWSGDPNDDILYRPGHGLSEVKEYADKFIIETNGIKYTKIPKNKKLEISRNTNIKQNSTKITLIKYQR